VVDRFDVDRQIAQNDVQAFISEISRWGLLT
jgi:hypothetical protein